MAGFRRRKAMKYLFSIEGRRALKELARADTLYAFDFDGTLAPIVADRQDAAIPAVIRRLLRGVSRVVPTAIVSGRALKDLRERVDGTVPYLIGNHGLEGSAAPAIMADRAQEVCALWRTQLAGLGDAALQAAGAEVEDKGLTLSIHYPDSHHQRITQAAALNVLQTLAPLPRLILGKHVINAVPPGSPHKGTALLSLMVRLHCHRAVYVGDDQTDEDIFGIDSKMVLGIRVGRNTESKAAYYLQERQADMVRLLKVLTRL